MSMQIPQKLPTDPGVSPSAGTGAARPVPAAAAAAVQQLEQLQAQRRQPTSEQVQKAVENLRQAVQSSSANLQFSVDGDTGKTIIRVVDGDTKEVIRQLPSEEVLQLAKSLDKLSGLLLKQKA